MSSYLDLDQNRFGQSPTPVLRLFFEKDSVPRSLDYERVPSVQYFTVGTTAPTYNATNDAAPDTFNDEFLLIGESATHLTVTLGTGTGSLPRVMARIAATFDLNVRWLTHDGLWHMHPDDQWTTTGRGQASATHDVEVYEIPRNVIGVNFVAAAGPANLQAFASATQDYK